MEVKCKNPKCKGEPPFTYRLREPAPKRYRTECPHGHSNEFSKAEIEEAKLGQIANPPSLEQNQPAGGQEILGQIANPPSLGQNASPIAKQKDRVKGFTATRAPNDTLNGEFGRNGGDYLLKEAAFEFFKENKVTPLDLKIVKCWTGGVPGSRYLTKIAERVGKAKQFVAYRTKKLIELGILTQIPGFNGAYEKSLKYLGWSIPALRAQIEANKPLIEWEPPAEFEQEQSRPKVKPRQKAPERLTVEMHDPLFRLIPDDLRAYRAKSNVSIFWYNMKDNPNNPVRYIPDKVFNNFGRDTLLRKDYYVGVKTRGLDVFLYPDDGDSQKVAIADLKARGEELKKKVEALYGLKFHWKDSIEKAMVNRPVSYVLKPDHSSPSQVKAQNQVTPAPAQQIQAQALVTTTAAQQIPTPAPVPVPAPAPSPVAPAPAPSPVAPAPTFSVQDLTQAFTQAIKQVLSQLGRTEVHILASDGSDPDGKEGKTDIAYDIAWQFNKIGEHDETLKKIPEVIKGIVKDAIKEEMNGLKDAIKEEMKGIGKAIVEAMKEASREPSQPNLEKKSSARFPYENYT